MIKKINSVELSKLREIKTNENNTHKKVEIAKTVLKQNFHTF